MKRTITCYSIFCCAFSFFCAFPYYVNASPPTIRNIEIKINKIFEGENLGSIYEAANKLKIETRKDVIKRELLFKSGDPYDRFLIEESERNLRALKFIRKVSITPTFSGDFVDLLVSVQDTWTLIPFFAVTSGSGSNDRVAVGLSDSDILGFGKRLEFTYEDIDGREAVEAFYEDLRVLGTKNSFSVGYVTRSDGTISGVSFGKPYVSLKTRRSWNIYANWKDTVGRLFDAGNERFIFRQEKADLSGYYSLAYGDPERKIHRYTVGYEYNDHTFFFPSLQDFDDVNVDPKSVLQNPRLVPEDRRFSYPFVAYSAIEADYISLNYVDRFDRVEDYNLGNVFSAKLGFAPETLGSRRDAALFSLNDADGLLIGESTFLRGELGVGFRVEGGEINNALVRAEGKFFSILGPQYLGGLYVGKHTIASNLELNYGFRLDKDREFLLGADTGLRGYDSYTFFGDKSFLLNLE
ncbi:MAG: hypothetical protein D6808_05780, partial [Candidatus Dadabacteria bacterium]